MEAHEGCMLSATGSHLGYGCQVAGEQGQRCGGNCGPGGGLASSRECTPVISPACSPLWMMSFEKQRSIIMKRGTSGERTAADDILCGK